MLRDSRKLILTSAAALATLAGLTRMSHALPPPPANDSPATPQVIGPAVPLVVYGTTVIAANDISATTLPAPANDVDGPDVFYSFTPAAGGMYRVQLLPWQRAPLRSSERRFIIYIQDDLDAFLAGAEAPGDARPVHIDVALGAGTTYRIGVDHDAATHDEFPFTLLVDAIDGPGPDDCAGVEDLPFTVPLALLEDIDGAAADFTFTQGAGLCGVSGAAPTTAPGNDHVYRFTPALAGKYAIELASSGFDAVLYVNTSCPPVFPGGCLGASNHSTSGTTGGKHEFIVLDLAAATDYYVYVDNGSAAVTTGAYALIVDTAQAYEVNEDEPNDSSAAATPLATPLNGGQLIGPVDEDWWSVTGSTGDRVYAWANNGGSTNSTLDTDLALFASDGSTLIEFDDEDADGADAPIEDLRFVYATDAPVLAGARLTADAAHFLRVTDNSATGTVHRYRLHVGLEPDSRQPLAECEPNDTLAAADHNAKHYFSGVIDTAADADFYAFEATVGDRVFIAADGDPERDSLGTASANTDPNAFHPKLVIYDPAGDILISDVSDSNAVTSPPDYPAQGAFFEARTTGTHYVQVVPQSALSQVGPTETYELAIFLNDQAPGLGTEDLAPAVSLTPDFGADTIAVLTEDGQPGDTGICAVDLFDVDNVQLTGLAFTPGDPSVSFGVELIVAGQNGQAKLVVTDCAGNSACAILVIDVTVPDCAGSNFSNRTRTSLNGPLFVPDNQPAGPGVDSVLAITESGLVSDVNVTITIETISPPDMDVFLVSPLGTIVELITDRGSSLAFDITLATFDDDADEIMPLLSGDAPYTGTWLPEDPLGLAQLNGEEALGDWTLTVRDDSSSAGGGARLVSWKLDLTAGFASPQTFAGLATDQAGVDAGIASIELTSASNVQLELPPEFMPGDTSVAYTVSLVDPTMDGTGTVTVTDQASNTCQSAIALAGFDDAEAPASSGQVTTDHAYGAEVQADVPAPSIKGVVSAVDVPDSFLVGEVEVELTVDTEDLGRLASTLAHGPALAALLNRVGMDERGSVGLTKDNIWVTLDDDAPQADDAHLEPALGSIPFIGLHQPDGRGEFIGDGIATDDRDNMLLELSGVDAAGQWQLFVGDFRLQGTTQTRFRRWSMVLKSPCGAERYVGRAIDLAPGAGICALTLAGGAVNLQVDASFTPGDAVVDYAVELIDPAQPGSGTLNIEDCAANVAPVAITLAAAAGDPSPPAVGGTLDLQTFEYVGQASDDQPGDLGIASVELLPWSTNLQITALSPDPPSGASNVDFAVGLIDPGANGRGYVRVTDGCGLRGHALVEIDATAPVCTGTLAQVRRYFSTDEPLDVPDNNPTGVTSGIVVADAGTIGDLDLTVNIVHPFDDDVAATLISGFAVPLFDNIGSTGNDFIDTTLDDEAAGPMPDSSTEAPFTGSYQPLGGPVLSAFDGDSVAGGYSLRVADDADFNLGRLESWSLRIASADFPEAYDGRTKDSEALGSGVCSIELLAPSNLTLTIDPAFEPGDAIARYLVELTNPLFGGTATVRVSDCAGNTCEVPLTWGEPPCAASADCADTDADDLRDDSCLWWECDGGACLSTEIHFADMGGPFGACPPDGTADANDRFHALNCFSNLNTMGAAPYPCEAASPTAFNVDAGGPFGECCPDGVCDGNDAFHALNAFAGANPCACDPDGGRSFACPCAVPTDPPGNPVLCPPPSAGSPSAGSGQAGPSPAGGIGKGPEIAGRAQIRLVASAASVRPGGLVDVDVFLDGALADLRGYQLHVSASGGHSGALALADIAIHQRKDAALAGLGSWQAFNIATGQLLAGLDTAGVATPPDAYLATLTLRASADAAGAFTVDLLHDAADASQRTFLFPSAPGARIQLESTTPAVIRVR